MRLPSSRRPAATGGGPLPFYSPSPLSKQQNRAYSKAHRERTLRTVRRSQQTARTAKTDTGRNSAPTRHRAPTVGLKMAYRRYLPKTDGTSGFEPYKINHILSNVIERTMGISLLRIGRRLIPYHRPVRHGSGIKIPKVCRHIVELP